MLSNKFFKGEGNFEGISDAKFNLMLQLGKVFVFSSWTNRYFFGTGWKLKEKKKSNSKGK